MVYWVSPLKIGLSEKRVRELMRPTLKANIKTIEIEIEIEVRYVFY